MPVIDIPFNRGLVTDNNEGDWLDSLPVNMIAVPKPVLNAGGYMRNWFGSNIRYATDLPARGAILNDVMNIPFRVQGTKLVNDKTGQVLADVGGRGFASMPFSRNTQAIVSDGRLQFWDGEELTEIRNWEEGERAQTSQEGGIRTFALNYDGENTTVRIPEWRIMSEGRFNIEATIVVRDLERTQWIISTRTTENSARSGLYIEDGEFRFQTALDEDFIAIQTAVEGINIIDFPATATQQFDIELIGSSLVNNVQQGFFDGQIYNIRLSDFDPPHEDPDDEDSPEINNNRFYRGTLLQGVEPTTDILFDSAGDQTEIYEDDLIQLTGGNIGSPALSEVLVEADDLVRNTFYFLEAQVITTGADASGFVSGIDIPDTARVLGEGDVEIVFRSDRLDNDIQLFTENASASFREISVTEVKHGIISRGEWEEAVTDQSPLPPTDFNLENIIDATRNRSRYAFIQANSNTFGVTDLQNEQRPDYIAPFYGAEAEPGINIAIDSWRDYIVIFTRDTIEYFALTGSSEQIYQPVQSLNVRAGIIGIGCKTHYLDTFAFLGSPRPEPPSLFLANQGSYQEIATRRVQKYIRQYSESELAERAYLESVKYDGHDLLLVHLPRETLAYDHNASGSGDLSWTLLKSDADGDRTYRSIFHLYDGETWTMGDKFNNVVCEIDFENSHHAGEMVEFILDSQMVQARNLRLFDLEVDSVAGRSNKAYKIAVSTTIDGIQWQQEQWIEADIPMNFTRRVLLRVLGYVRNNVAFRLRWITDSNSAISNLRARFE